jgi:integrase
MYVRESLTVVPSRELDADSMDRRDHARLDCAQVVVGEAPRQVTVWRRVLRPPVLSEQAVDLIKDLFARKSQTRIVRVWSCCSARRCSSTSPAISSIPAASLERLWERRDIALRERTLWRLLYETAARADEILRLDRLAQRRSGHALAISLRPARRVNPSGRPGPVCAATGTLNTPAPVGAQ